MRKAYAEKILGPLPNFAVIEHVLNLGRPITLQEVEQLSVDADDSLTSSLKSAIADFEDEDETSDDSSGGEEENEEERRAPNEGLVGGENNDGGPIVALEVEGSNQDQLEVP